MGRRNRNRNRNKKAHAPAAPPTHPVAILSGSYIGQPADPCASALIHMGEIREPNMSLYNIQSNIANPSRTSKGKVIPACVYFQSSGLTRNRVDRVIEVRPHRRTLFFC